MKKITKIRQSKFQLANSHIVPATFISEASKYSIINTVSILEAQRPSTTTPKPWGLSTSPKYSHATGPMEKLNIAQKITIQMYNGSPIFIQ